MKPEEAISVLDSLLDGSIFDAMNYWYDHLETFYTALKTSKDALKKQIPVKMPGTYTNYKCAVCGRRIRSGKGSSSFSRDNFCQRCGQAVDWSED